MTFLFLNLLKSTVQKSTKILELHAKAGYYGVQIQVGGIYFDDEGMLTEEAIVLLKRQKEIVESVGLVPSAVGGCWDADWTKCIKPHIQAANVLGSPYVYGPFATPFLYFPEGESSGNAAMDWVDGQIERFAKLLREEIGPFAAEYGVTLCEEPLQRFERMPIRLERQLSWLLKLIPTNLRSWLICVMSLQMATVRYFSVNTLRDCTMLVNFTASTFLQYTAANSMSHGSISSTSTNSSLLTLSLVTMAKSVSKLLTQLSQLLKQLKLTVVYLRINWCYD